MFTRANAAAMGRRGGLATVKAYGHEHMRAIGRKGFQVTTDKHFQGDRHKHLNHLIKLGLRAMDPAPWNGVWQDYNAFPDRPKEDPPDELPY
jgi:general stress protein YciG